ncbi:MAG: YgiQ family radical SAM protein [Desulfonatronovibrio sp.]
MGIKLFLPMTRNELEARKISRPDVILVSGDAYIDSSFSGVAIIGRVLEAAGYSVGIISQPDLSSPGDITALGEPGLFWGVTAGCVDSEIANYTALGKPRRSCDFTPGGENRKRPDRACIVYSNLIRRYFKNTVPIVLGGMEASLRRIAHYDFRTDRVRKSILLDAKADILVYGMGEQQVLQIADRLRDGKKLNNIPGTCVMGHDIPNDYIALPECDHVEDDPAVFARMFKTFYENSQGPGGRGLAQKYGLRYLIHHPPAPLLSMKELDRIYELPFMNNAHPDLKKQGEIRALETIRDSITTHRGCYGECSFCSIAVHQGRSVVSRSMDSIVREAEDLVQQPGFSGTIRDVGGATANMYASGCSNLLKGEPCLDRHCTGFNGVCSKLNHGHLKQKRLLSRLRALPGVKRVHIASGIRYDLILADKRYGSGYLEQIIREHVPGQMKIAPEHCSDGVLRLMNKPPGSKIKEFANFYRKFAEKFRRNVFLSCYVIAAHPGCTLKDMDRFREFARINLRFSPEQVQIFTPTPSTRSTAMYWSGIDPFTGKEVWSEKGIKGKSSQKQAVQVLDQGKPSSGRSEKTKKGKKIRNSKQWKK